MSDISQLQINGTTYNLIDATARETLTFLTTPTTYSTQEDIFDSVESGWSITIANAVKLGNIITLYLRFSSTSALTATTHYSVGTLKSAFRPPIEAGGAVGGANGDITYVQASGLVKYCSSAAKSANTNCYLKAVYITTN